MNGTLPLYRCVRLMPLPSTRRPAYFPLCTRSPRSTPDLGARIEDREVDRDLRRVEGGIVLGVQMARVFLDHEGSLALRKTSAAPRSTRPLFSIPKIARPSGVGKPASRGRVASGLRVLPLEAYVEAVYTRWLSEGRRQLNWVLSGATAETRSP